MDRTFPAVERHQVRLYRQLVELAAQLLGVDSIEAVGQAIIDRAMLRGGRFEAHEFGRDQHSSASAGGVLNGLAGIPELPDHVLAPVVDAAAELINPAGTVRTHDSDPQVGSTSWSEAQILAGLLRRPALALRHREKLITLTRHLLSRQDAEGGWPLRFGDAAEVTFAFYSAMALARAHRSGLGTHEVRTALAATARHVTAQMAADRLTLEEQILARGALDAIPAQLRTPAINPAPLPNATLLDSCWDQTAGFRLRNHTIVVYRQPAWHTITWRPLLYLCARHWASPLNPTNALLAAELVRSFDPAISAWAGPVDAVRLGTGVSWASGLALLGVSRLARDLARIGANPAHLHDRARSLSTESYKYDVAISFAGADRQTAVQICDRLKDAGLRVFYDRDYQHTLLGEDLTQHLQSTYLEDSRFAIVLVSRAFVASDWAGNWEWRAVLARMQRQRGGYVLPYIMEDVTLPGLNPTLGYVDARDYSPVEFAELVIRKIRSQPTLRNDSS
jgi:TIR domain